MSEVAREPTGRQFTWEGLTFNQVRLVHPHFRTTRMLFALDGRPDVTIRRVSHYYLAKIGDRELPTKFRAQHTAARAISRALND